MKTNAQEQTINATPMQIVMTIMALTIVNVSMDLLEMEPWEIVSIRMNVS